MHGWLSFPFCLVIFGLAAAAEVDEVEQLCTQDVCGDVLETTLTDTGDSEAELLKVSMLQTVLSVGSRRELVDRGRGRADALSQGTGQAATATIQAQGQVLSDEPNHNTVASVERRSITSLAIPASDSPLTADSLSDEGAEVDKEVASLSQLNASRSTMSASACSGLIQAERLGATCIGGVSTLELRSQLDLLRLSGMFPPRNPQLVAQQVEVNPFAEQSLHFWSTKAGHEELIIAVYIMFYLVSMSLMYYWMINPPAHRGLDMSCQAKRIKTDIDVEEEVYRSSSLGWLSVSWASPWVARWGHSLDASRTKIKPGELPQMGSRENQSREAAVTFERLWEQEVREVGLENASVFRVLLQMWSYRTMAYMLFILICQVLVVQIYSVFLIESAMNYFHWLQAYVKLHGVYPDVSNTLLLSIVGFLTLPFSNIFFTSITSSVSCRLDQLTCGGLSIALFRKSQRLPAFTTTPKKEEDGEEEQPMGVTTDTEKESQADLMNLINYDVNTNLIGAYLVLCVATTTSIAFLALTALLWIRLHFATLFALGCAVPVLFFSAFFMGGLAGSFANLQTMIDKRIGVLREVLYGIRIVKGYAWESAMEEKVIALRKQEMTGLTTYFHYLGGLLGIFLGFPRVLVIAGLWGYSLLYGQHDVTTIFTCMQILSSLRWSCDVFIKALSQAILISPSIKRVEAFLRLQEAPLLPDSTPSWVKMWPGPQPESEALSDVDTPVALMWHRISGVQCAVRACGRTAVQPSWLLQTARRAGTAVREKEPEYTTGELTGYKVFHQKEPFQLSNGAELPELQVAYETWGELNAHRDNVILLQCGMSASSHACSHTRNPVRGWWEDFIGPGRPLDTNLFHVICTNNLGGCYGSSGPSSVHPADGRRYGSRFPRFEVFDQVAAQFALLDHLGIQKLHACVGASLGGMQSICAAGRFPERVGKFVSISACAKSFPGSMAFRHAQRMAVMSDPNFQGGDYYEGPLPASGLRLARQLGTITYRSGQEWHQRFGQRRHKDAKVAPKDLSIEWEIERYLAHQGEKWVNNYDPNSMLWISKAMDGFTMEKPDADGCASLTAGLADAMQPALVIGVQHDVLFPVWQQKEVADSLRAAGNRRVVYYELDSIYGHDAFLLDAVSIGPAVKGHLEQEPGGAAHLWQDMAATAANALQAAVSRSATADSLRDLFRALSGGNETVDRDRLRNVVRMVWGGRVSELQIDTIFAEKLPHQAVKLPQFLQIRESLVAAEHEGAYETYLP